ncbi:hypothetical protein M8C21_005690, partial [Ambrosia artemisiifolia]
DMMHMTAEAKSKPMTLSHDIVPRGDIYMVRIVLHEWAQNLWKIINPAFHVERIKHMFPAFYVSCSELIPKWGEMIGEDGVGEVDVWPDLQMFTSDVISRTTFGSYFEEGRKIFDLQNEQAKLVLKAARSIFLPTKTNKRMKEIDRLVKDSVRSIIDKRVVSMKDGVTRNDDLLSILLDSNNKEIKEQKCKDFGLSFEEVIEECKLFYFAGQETSANMLVWTMILLAYHTDWQTCAREEVLGVLGKRKPNLDELNHLKLCLRLYPLAIALRRETHEETKLGNITLPAQTLIRINSIFIQHDPNIWGDDANEFKPERFSKGVSKVTNGQSSYLPFGGGPRICIGQNFAMLEVKMAYSSKLLLQVVPILLACSAYYTSSTTSIWRPLDSTQNLASLLFVQ